MRNENAILLGTPFLTPLFTLHPCRDRKFGVKAKAKRSDREAD